MESEIRAAWLGDLLSTKPAARQRAEAGLRDVYLHAGFGPPTHFFWFDSPFTAALAEFLLMAAHDSFHRRLLNDFRRDQQRRERIDAVRAALCEGARLDWETLTAVTGGTAMENCWIPNESNRAQTILPELAKARAQIHADWFEASRQFDESDALFRAEKSMSAILEGHKGSAPGPSVQYPLAGRYSFSEMALDEAACLRMDRPPLLAAVWTVSRDAGRWWWPFAGCVVLAERPIEVHVNERSVPHRLDGPAIVYRDGTRVWAFNGCHVREDDMLHPENIPAAQLKRASPAFRAFVEGRIGKTPPQKPARKDKSKSSIILKKALPAQPAERVELLRKHNSGRLPFFDRYMGGEHHVWAELVTLGASVRADPYAADALAVAYEIMSRVDVNIREIAARLSAIGYEGAEGTFHVPPGAGTSKVIALLEKRAGALPLSLRAFYDVVGAVNLMGEHPSLAPSDGSITADPLVVNSAEEALDQFEGQGRDPDADQFLIELAPDAFHKAKISGGEPYEIAVPELRADGPLIWERHELYFVDYLRLAFRFGGFPGYDGIEPLPAELASLTADLVPF
jgi:hypothetical protein